MGMYTGLRGQVTLKPEVAKLMGEWYDDDIISEAVAEHFEWNVWNYVAKSLSNDKIAEFAQMSRSSFIPNGAVCYMPPDWEFQREIVQNVLYFCCSLKNYCGTIDAFIQLLPEIATAWDLEELYEEDTESTFHKNIE